MKYDYNALKLEYFTSDIDNVRAFMEQKLGKKTLSGSLNKKVNGRPKEKAEYRQKILDKALEANAKKQAEQLEMPVETLKKAKYAAVAKVMKLLEKPKDGAKEVKLSVADMERVLKIIKTELGEPTTISKNENLNKGTVLNEADFIQD
jgi:hypothetical protein